MALGRWTSRQVTEIATDPVLRWYGAALALVNALTAVDWLGDQALSRVLAPTVAPICWPFVDTCYGLRALGPEGITAIVFILLIAAVLNAALFLGREDVGAAYGTLIIVSAIKYILLLQDFRLTLNHHYMALWVLIPFLFLPDKRRVIRYLVVIMYVWAGTLKLHPSAQWLTGAAFYGRRPLGLPASLIPLECGYVIILELVIVFGLLARRRWLFWGAFAQFVLFHIASFWVVGWFYPLLMFLLLSIFPLDRLSSCVGEASRAQPLAPRSWLAGQKPATKVLLASFCAAQLVPLVLSSDPAMTGEGRIFALNMFDAPIECRATALVHREGANVRTVAIQPPFLGTRTRCDPIVYLYAAKNYCRAITASGGVEDIDLLLKSRRQGEEQFHTVVSVPSFCQTNPSYRLLQPNWWIQSPREDAHVGAHLSGALT